jgi:hypothetical protein
VVSVAEERSVQLVFEDGQRLWFPYAALVVEYRAPKAIRTCACGDILRTVNDEAAARKAFATSDARFALSLRAYLGTLKNKLSKALYIVTSYSKCTTAPTYENLCQAPPERC